jgi:hypothetical protein
MQNNKKEELSFAKSVEQVKKVTQTYLSGDLDGGKKALASLLYLVGAGNLKIRNKEKDGWKQASENGLPAAFYVSGGGRMIFEFSDDLAAKNKAAFKNMFQDYGEQQRGTSTHALVKKDGTVKEIKTNGIKDYVTNSQNHFGLDLDIPTNNADSKGHMYIGKFENGMMVGVENAAPGKAGHKWYNFGKSNEVSAFGVEKFRVQEVKKKIAGEAEYKKTVVPGKYTCMRVIVNDELVAGLKTFQETLNAGTIENIGSKIPARNVADFENAKVHQAPEMKPAQAITAPEKPKALGLKKTANGIMKVLQYILAPTVVVPIISKLISGKWIAKPYQKEIKESKEESKDYKIQASLVKTYNNSGQTAEVQAGNQGVETNQKTNEINSEVRAQAKSEFVANNFQIPSQDQNKQSQIETTLKQRQDNSNQKGGPSFS